MVAQGRNELDGGGVGEGGADVMTDERRSHKGVFFFFFGSSAYRSPGAFPH